MRAGKGMGGGGEEKEKWGKHTAMESGKNAFICG